MAEQDGRDTGTDRGPRQEQEGRSAPRAEDHRDQPPGKPFYKRPLVMVPLALVAVAVAVGGTLWWLQARHYESTDDAFIDGHAVQVTPKVSGYVVRLLIDDNAPVRPGDLMLEIDPRDYQVSLEQARAAEASAQARLGAAQAQVALNESGVASARADVAAADATARNAAEFLARTRELEKTAAAAQEQLESVRASARSTAAQLTATRAKLDQAEAQLAQSKAQLAIARADVRQAEAQVRLAELNLSYTQIRAPVLGRVTHRTVELGDFVQPGQALFALVEPNVWVTANFKETQLTNMQPGQPVAVKVDAYPDRPLAAHVDSFQRGSGARFTLLPPENATGNYVKVVQRVPVKIVFDEPPPADMRLGPGMSVVPRVKVR